MAARTVPRSRRLRGEVAADAEVRRRRAARDGRGPGATVLRRALLGLLLAANVEAQGVPVAAPAPATPAGPLTLRQAIAAAVAGNPGLAATRLKGKQIEAMLDESRAAFLPWLGFNYGWNRGDWPHIIIAQEVDARDFPENGFFNDPGTFTVYGAMLEAKLNLWAGGRDRARRDMLTTATEICGTENDMAKNALVGQVIETFFEVLSAEERLEAAERLVETARTRRDEEQERFAQGAVLEADLAEVEARLAEAEAGVVFVRAARARSLAALAIALGLPAASELTLVDEGDPDPPDLQLPADYDSALARALEGRPELARARLMAKRFELGVTMARADYLPRLDTYWSIGLYRDGEPIPEISREQKVWYANLMLSWPIFDGGARAARVAKARAELDEFREVDRQTTLAVEQDVQSAYLRLDEAKAGLRAAESRLAAARQRREVRAAQREAGAATAAAALEGEQLLTDARMARTNAAFGLRKAAADAARALGLFVNAGGPAAPCCGPVPEGN